MTIKEIRPSTQEEVQFWENRKPRGRQGGGKNPSFVDQVAEIIHTYGSATLVFTGSSATMEAYRTANSLRSQLVQRLFPPHIAIDDSSPDHVDLIIGPTTETTG